MPTKTWKSREAQIAKSFGTERTPLSGGNSKHTRSDTLHPRLFIEQKHRKRHSVVTLWDETNVLAAKEGKVPVVTLTEHGRPGFWVLVHCDDLKELAEELLLCDRCWSLRRDCVCRVEA
jgi:hypothetical protein